MFFQLPTWTVSAFYVVAAVVSSVIVFSSLVAESPLISRISEGLHGKFKDTLQMFTGNYRDLAGKI